MAAAAASALAIAAPAFARSGLEVEDLLAPPVQVDQADRATTLPATERRPFRRSPLQRKLVTRVQRLWPMGKLA
jgi:hypothetical protein